MSLLLLLVGCARNVYERLYGMDAPTMKLLTEENRFARTGLVLSEARVDESTWEFTLQPGVRFHDGSPLDAEAVACNLAAEAGHIE